MKFYVNQALVLLRSKAVFPSWMGGLPTGIFFFFLFSSISNKGYAQDPERPNILIIIADDMGWSDIGYNGSEIKTPNLDKLEREGIRLNNNYVMATCTPTRVGLFTGKYASSFGVLSPAYGELIPETTPTLASLLREKDYYTALVGKWHMGSPPYIPLKYGFETAYGYLDGQLDPYTHRYKEANKFTTGLSWNGEGDYLKKENIKGILIDTSNTTDYFKYIEEGGHYTDLITDQAIDLIKMEKEKPFFIYLAYGVPHFPLNESTYFTDPYDSITTSKSRGRYAASITHMDSDIGRIMRALEDAGKRENTLIIFTSDNGAQKSWNQSERATQYGGMYANVSHDVLGNNFPLRGWKGDLYEGGIRVPGFINWPHRLKRGTLDSIVAWVDWMPTLLSITGSSAEELDGLGLNGNDISPFLYNDDRQSKLSGKSQRTLYWETPKSSAIREENWKLIKHKADEKVELFNIKTDFRELSDVSRQYPEKVKTLESELTDFQKSTPKTTDNKKLFVP